MIIGWVDTDLMKHPTSVYTEECAKFASWLLYKLTAEKYPGISSSTEWYGLDKYTCTGATCDLVSDFFELPPSTARRGVTSLRLRHTPVVEIESLEVGGQIVDPSFYRVGNKADLIRVDGGCWDTTAGVTVTYKHGLNPPFAGRVAATYFADELVASYLDEDNCSLPDRVTSVSRQNISYDILDPQQFIVDGRTGVYQVDLFIRAANPTGASKKPKVFSADAPRGINYR